MCCLLLVKDLYPHLCLEELVQGQVVVMRGRGNSWRGSTRWSKSPPSSTRDWRTL